MCTSRKWFFIAACVSALLVAVIAGTVPAHAADVMQTKTVGTYRVELHVLPAEPFFSKQDVADKHVKDGMEIEGGAAPVAPDADSHSNHHLIVHVFDKKTGKVVSDATVTMSFVALDGKGSPAGTPSDVAVVVMQAIGKGPASTHYGNNVTMPAGRYRVTVTVNGKQVVFIVSASNASGTMAPMKM